MQKANVYRISALIGLFSGSAQAQQAGGVEFSALLLTVAIVLGIASCLYVILLSHRMKGSDVGAALLFYGMGMLSVVVSLLSVTWLKSVMGDAAGPIHDAFFILGFLVMVAGSRRVASMFSR